MSPSTMKQWVIQDKEHDLDGLVYQDAAVPKVGENEVLVRLEAASLNYRDLIIPKGQYPFALDLPVVPGSDGAGEVVEVGCKVAQFKKGDRVATLFNQGHQYGEIDSYAAGTGLGGVIDGTLREYGVFNEQGLVKAPSNLTALEASTLPCAALTSWNALYGLKPLKPGQVVLVQGTGGVSIFGLQFAKAAGATVIATTSSAEKAEKLKKLGADHVINYKNDPNWGETARKLTPDAAGVDHIIEVGGSGTLQQSFKCVKFEGIISVIGFLGGVDPKTQPTVLETLSNICTVRGVYVGSKALMKDMIRAIEANDIHPVVDDKVFTLDQAREAYDYMLRFTVTIESSSSFPTQSWEAQIWHNITGSEWTSLSLREGRLDHTPLLTGDDSEYNYHRHVFSGELLLPAAGGHARFTVRFRTGPDTDWQWANQKHPVSDGEIVYSPRHSDLDKRGSTDPTTQAPGGDLGRYIDNLNHELQIKSRLSEAPGSVLWTLSGDIDAVQDGASTIKRLSIGTPSSVVRYFSLVRVWSPWLGPRHGKDKFRLTEDAILCSFLREDGRHLVMLAVSGVNDVLTVFRSNEKGEVVVTAKSDNSEPSRFHVLVSAAEDFEVAISALIYEARKVVRPFANQTNIDLEEQVPLSPPGDDMVIVEKDPTAQWLSEWFDGLTYCTWNGLGQDLTEERILHALDTLKSNGINIVNLIIDDGWQTNDNEGNSQFQQRWKQFEAHPKGFPKGLKHTVEAIHRVHPAQRFKTKQVKIKDPSTNGPIAKNLPDGKILAIDPDDVQRFYDEFYGYLSSVGIDSVKTDAQFFIDLLEDPEDRQRFMTSYQDAWSIASLKHFSTRAISCGSMTPQIIFHSQMPTNKPTIPLRNSDDFFPDVPASHPWHVFCNAHNSLLTRFLNVLPDWDMFQTSHPYASFHAAARCVSGGPIYITDEPGKHDLTVLDQIAAPTVKGTTVILRPSVIGRTIDMYHGYNEGHLLRVGSYTGWAKTGSGILGLFNINSAQASSIVSLMDFPGIHEDSHGHYIVRAHSSGKISTRMRPLTQNSLVAVVLEPEGWEILTAYPTCSFTLKGSHGCNPSGDGLTHVAVLGLLGKMTGAAAVVTSDISLVENGRLRFDISLKALGTLGIYFSDLQDRTIARNFMVMILGRAVPEETVWIEGGETANVLAIDVLAAWKAMKLDSGWSNEAFVQVFVG
ncbi:hypothetical protein N7457_003266 [Penicillium paradoxum]|uniref:uncharacterized protein n=1 Tax=Penicillium paradoxum TaxID=176176 RepID=UPI002548B4C1|nr:uncharacterized protein N7457_003266 [Penicillium paradoxum]KAJ5788276.1 hypothetical protein N7457_003266 [Penicillium paradoxum]